MVNRPYFLGSAFGVGSAFFAAAGGGAGVAAGVGDGVGVAGAGAAAAGVAGGLGSCEPAEGVEAPRGSRIAWGSGALGASATGSACGSGCGTGVKAVATRVPCGGQGSSPVWRGRPRRASPPSVAGAICSGAGGAAADGA